MGKKKKGGKKRGGKSGNKQPRNKKNNQQKKKKVNDIPMNEDDSFLDFLINENKEKKKETLKKIPEFDISKVDISKGQTWPNPTIPVKYLYSDNKYDIGEIQDYSEQYMMKISKTEKEEEDLKYENVYEEMRHSGEVHRQVRRWIQESGEIKPGISMIDLANKIEDKVELLVGFDPNNPTVNGLGFPIGCSLNDCAAHYTPNPKDNRILKKDDVLKIDIGTHTNGIICDSAFTMIWNPQYEELLSAVKAATNAGVKEAGIGVRIKDIGKVIEEVMESYECTLNNGKTYPVKVIRNLCGHSVGRYKIHTGVSISCTKDSECEEKLEENKFYAIETFGVINGSGYIEGQPDCSHFMLNYQKFPDILKTPPQGMNTKEKNFFEFIRDRFKTICFSRRYIERIGKKNKDYYMVLRSLIKKKIIKDYAPLSDKRDSFVAQFEHSFRLRPTKKEVFSRGEDY